MSATRGIALFCGDRHVDLRQADAAPGDAVLVAHDLRRIAGELDAGLLWGAAPVVNHSCTWCSAASYSGIIEMSVDRRRLRRSGAPKSRSYFGVRSVHRLLARHGTCRPTPSSGSDRCRAGARGKQAIASSSEFTTITGTSRSSRSRLRAAQTRRGRRATSGLMRFTTLVADLERRARCRSRSATGSRRWRWASGWIALTYVPRRPADCELP